MLTLFIHGPLPHMTYMVIFPIPTSDLPKHCKLKLLVFKTQKSRKSVKKAWFNCLTFSVPPKIILENDERSEVTRVAKGDEFAELKCKAQGDTPITVKWTKVSDRK